MEKPELAVGQAIRDNDPRNNGRVFTITSVSPEFIGYHSGARRCSVSRNRVFTDGRKRTWGWSVVTS